MGSNAASAADDGGEPSSRSLVENRESNLDVRLLVTAQSTSHGIEKETLCLVDGFGGDVFELQGGGPAGHLRGNRLFSRGNRVRR